MVSWLKYRPQGKPSYRYPVRNFPPFGVSSSFRGLTYAMEYGTIMAKKQYVPVAIEIKERGNIEIDPNGGNKYSLPYGIAKGLGLNTDGMSPREVWEMLKGHGITPENEYEKLKEKAKRELPSEEVKEQKVDDQVIYSNENQRERIKSFRQEYQKKGHEFGLVLDENGNTFVFREGNTGSVGFYRSEYSQFKGKSLTHNHPQGNTFLSYEDLTMLSSTGLRSIEAVGYDGWIHTVEVIPQDNAEMLFGMERRLVSFANDYHAVMEDARKKARAAWDSQPMKQVKSGRYLLNVPENWTLYRKGASPRDYTNYNEYTQIIQEALMEFSRDAEKKYGVRSIFRKEE